MKQSFKSFKDVSMDGTGILTKRSQTFPECFDSVITLPQRGSDVAKRSVLVGDSSESPGTTQPLIIFESVRPPNLALQLGPGKNNGSFFITAATCRPSAVSTLPPARLPVQRRDNKALDRAGGIATVTYGPYRSRALRPDRTRAF